MDAPSGQPWIWIAINIALGLPIALALLVGLREGIRTAIAIALGFRVFELGWGAGRRVLERPVGTVDVSLGRWPVAGTTLARSGSPRRHQLGRVSLALAPALFQGLWLCLRLLTSRDPFAAIATGPAPLALLDLGNALLLGVHLILPLELGAGVRTDARLFFDALLAPPESNRVARASYYARLARMSLERSDVTRARDALERGLVQLGREPLLVACQQRFDETDLQSVVDQGDCADALRVIIDAAEPEAEAATRSGRFGQRVARHAILATPLMLVVSVAIASQTGAFIDAIESSWFARSAAVASGEDPAQCTDYRDRWAAWARTVDPWRTPSPSARSDRHLAFAQLETCRGDLASASEHQGEAMLAANAARAEFADDLLGQPQRWLANELRLTGLFRHAATVEHDRQAYREALVAISNGERRLQTVRRRLALWPAPDSRAQAFESVAGEEAELRAIREQVMASLAAR